MAVFSLVCRNLYKTSFSHPLVCGESFKELSHLKQHCRLYHGREAIVCTVCFFQAKNEAELQRHREQGSEECKKGKCYVCHICHKELTRIENLSRHCRVIHGVDYSPRGERKERLGHFWNAAANEEEIKSGNFLLEFKCPNFKSCGKCLNSPSELALHRKTCPKE